MNLFVYGPLFFPEVWRLITPKRFIMVNAMLDGYACLRITGRHTPALVPLSSAVTDGFIYKEIDDSIIDRTDDFLGPIYQRQNVSVRMENGEVVPAMTYVLHVKNIGLALKYRWSAEAFRRNHLQEYLKSRQDFYMPDSPSAHQAATTTGAKNASNGRKR